MQMSEKEHMSKVLLDTNLLTYSIDKDSKYFDKTRNLFSEPEIELFTTSKNLSEFLAVMTRMPKAPLPLKETLLIIKDFQEVFTILYPTEQSSTIFLNLLQKYQPIGLKIHDFEIISIALANQINMLVTFNKKDFDIVTELEFYQFE